MRERDNPNVLGSIALIVYYLYMIVGSLYSMFYLIVSTVEVYQFGGPIAAMFWFWTIGPLVATLAGMFWPIAIWVN